MGIYSKTVENKLLNSEVQDNILFGYDNYTYHIQFFMLPYKIQQEYSSLKSSLQDNEKLTRLLNNNKIIIAESGYSSDLNIVSYTATTVPATASDTLSSISTEMTLNIEEVGGNSLVNKLALTSALLGYSGYVGQPYFVSVWFTGYENRNSTSNNVVKKIDNRVYTYQVIIDDVKTNVDFNKTSYTFHMATINYEAISKEFALVNDVSQFSFKKGYSFNKISEIIDEKMNEKYKEMYGKEIMEKIYQNKNPLEIDIVYPKELTSIPVFPTSYKFKPDETITLDRMFKELWEVIHPKSSYVPVISYDLQFMGCANNKSFFCVKMHVIIQKIPGLDTMKEKIVTNTYFNDIEKEQDEYLNGIIEAGSLVKRYYYNLNGKDTSVLSYDQSEDNLWYLNTAVNDVQEVYDNTIQNNYKEYLNVEEEQEIVGNTFDERLKTYRDSVKDNRVYMDDIFNLLTAKDKAGLVAHRYRASTFSDVLANKPSGNTPEEETKEQTDDISDINSNNTLAHIGAENMLSTGQKIELKLNILGDPYWMEFGTEGKQDTADLLLPHVVMCIKSFTKTNGYDEYKEDKLMEINTLYRIIEIVSTFADGKFTQALKGVVATPFVQSSKNTSYTTNMTRSKNITIK